MAPESLAKLLGEHAEIRPLALRLDYIKRLQRRYRTLVPEQLAEASRVCAIDGTTVVICATSGPVASVLRQLAPRLLEGLRAAARKSPKDAGDQQVTGIRVEVQVASRQPPRRVAPRGEMPREKLAELARSLEDSPLKETLERMARKPRR